MKQRSKRLIVVSSLTLLLIVLGVWRWGGWGNRERHVIRVSGNIELTEVDIAFKSAGKLVKLAVNEGDTVQKGSLVAVLDQSEISLRRDSAAAAVQSAESRLDQLRTAIAYQKEQVEGQLARSQAEVQQAEAALQELLHGSRKQEIEAARAALTRAETEHTRAERDWERAQTLYKDEDISTAQYDDFRARFESAKAQRTQAKQQLDLIEEGPRKEDIEAGRAQFERAKANLRLAEAARLELRRMQQEQVSREADIQQAKAQLGVSETQLRDTEVMAPMDGVVLSKSAEPGEVLAAGTTVVTLGNVAKPWLRAYINETDLGRVRLGTEVRVTTDSFPGKVYKGKLTFIASEAEFTPKQIQTQEERVKLVYRTKIEIENPNGELKSNMPADAEIPLAGHES
jgi:HlyD family secretion protein